MSSQKCTNCSRYFVKKDPRNSGLYCSRACYQNYRADARNSSRYITCARCSLKKIGSRRTQQYCTNKCEILDRYEKGFKASTLAANEAVRINGQPKLKGRAAHWLDSANEAEIRKKISKSKLGSKNAMYGKVGILHHNWRGGNNKTIWKTVEYQRWRKAVMRKDNFTCIKCGDNRGGNLQADHIKPRYLFPELTFDVNNGRTLCTDCHKLTSTWGNKVKSLNRADFA